MTKNCVISKLAISVHCKLLMLLPHNSATLTGIHTIILCHYPVKPRVPYQHHCESDFGDYFNIHNYHILLPAFIKWWC